MSGSNKDTTRQEEFKRALGMHNSELPWLLGAYTTPLSLSVVISGSLPKDGGRYSLYAAIIVKRVDAQTRSKTSINELLRD